MDAEELSADPAEIRQKALEQRCDALLKELVGEWCVDSVLIAITFRSPHTGQTLSLTKTDGNWYASSGVVREWIEKDIARTHKYINEME